MSHSIVGINLTAYRKAQNLTQQQLADYLDILREEISYYENGTREIPTILISKCADLFGIDEYDLYSEDTDARHINLAFAFRADGLSTGDLETIAAFKKIAINYLKMKKAIANE